MAKKLSKHGDSLALVLDPDVLALLNVTEDTPLSIKTAGQAIIITPAPTERTEKFQAALDKVNAQYGPVFKKLAE